MKKIPRIIVFQISKKKEKDALLSYLHNLEGIEITSTAWFFRSPKTAEELFGEIGSLIPSNPYFYFFETHGQHLGIGNQEINHVIKGRGKWV